MRPIPFVCGSARRFLPAHSVTRETANRGWSPHPLRTGIWADRPTWTAEEAQFIARRKHPRVPLLIKLPHVSRSTVYRKPIDCVLIHDRTLLWMEGQDLTPAAVTAERLTSFSSQNRGRFPVHVAREMPHAPMADRWPE